MNPSLENMAKNHPLAGFDRSDPLVLERLARIQRICLYVIIFIAVITLAAWIVSGVGVVLPSGFTLMKFNTAVALLASAISLALSVPHRSRRSLNISRALAVGAGLLGGASLVEHAFGVSLGVDTLIAADSSSYHPGLMSVQAGS